MKRKQMFKILRSGRLDGFVRRVSQLIERGKNSALTCDPRPIAAHVHGNLNLRLPDPAGSWTRIYTYFSIPTENNTLKSRTFCKTVLL